MSVNTYMNNRQKLLYMVEELHKRGFGKLEIIPSISPSGMHWRCTFIDETKNHNLIATNWLYDIESSKNGNIKLSIKELASLFIQENLEFVNHCRGKNKRYNDWYREMLKKLSENELPYAFSDFYYSTSIWKTTLDNEIKTLSND